MKKIYLIGTIIVLAAVGVLLWMQFGPRPQNPPAQTQNGFPTSTSANPGTVPGMTVETPHAGSIDTKNFLADPETKEDPSNKGNYYLGNQPDSPSPYVIEYIAATSYFNISLLQEPIGQARAEAESYLLNHLGVTQDQLCALDYMVSTPDSVNSIYSDENLGFSFCPGAVKLP